MLKHPARRSWRAAALALALLLLAAALPACAPEPRLVWSDEFDYTGLPDPSRWGYEVGRIRNREWQYYTYGRLENAAVADGLLTITAARDNFEGELYTSASLTTRETFTFTRGTVKVRARLPQGRGTWPAVWMLGENISSVGWPRCGEIDIMEHVGYDPGRVHTSIHTEARNHIRGTQATSSRLIDDPWGFHEYAVRWERDQVIFLLDGVETYRYTNDGGGEATWPFDQPMFLIINLAIGGDWGGQKGVDQAIFPARYQIDYVRVYAEG